MSKSSISLCLALLACSSSTEELPAPMQGGPFEGSEPLNAAATSNPPSRSNAMPAPSAVTSAESPMPAGLSSPGATENSSAASTAAPDAGAGGADASAPEPLSVGPEEPPSVGPEEPPSLEPGEPLTIYLAGDSIVSTYVDTPSPTDQAGWGQMIGARFDARITIDNRALGGRTARRFIDEGYLASLLADIRPGDYLFVQFGTNDGNRTATYTLGDQTIPYYLDPNTDFKTYLQQYIDGARRAGALPVFVTPPPRNSAYCTGGNGTGAHARAMLELGAEHAVPVIDLNAKSVAFLIAICPSPTPEDFFLLRADGTVDGTHFQERGARFLAGFVVEGITEAALPLNEYLIR